MLVGHSPTPVVRLAAGGAVHPRPIFFSSYPPRECGIATFAEDVRDAYDRLVGHPSGVIAINEPGGQYQYAPCVVCAVQRDNPASYVEAARFVNASDADIVNIQHEYGLFGGERGAYILEFLKALRRPAIITLHTTLPDPDRATLSVTRDMCHRADRVMVLTESSRRIMERRYDVDPAKLCVVMHGVPDAPPYHGPFHKRRFGLEPATVISTFGLLSRGKGIETIIDALPSVISRHPDCTYVLWGKTHPEIRRIEGEAYRTSLLRRAEALGVADHIQFLDRYMTDEEVVAALLATDVYVSPSLDPHQAVSGTLSYAVACGRAVIATEYQYAKELLGNGRGITVPFRDPGALADAVNGVLSDAALRQSLETNAYQFGRRMIWPKVAAGYRQAFADSLLAGLTFTAYQFGA